MQSLFSAKSVAQVKKKNEKNYRQRAEQELWKRCKPTFHAPHHSSARRINILFFPLELATNFARKGENARNPTHRLQIHGSENLRQRKCKIISRLNEKNKQTKQLFVHLTIVPRGVLTSFFFHLSSRRTSPERERMLVIQPTDFRFTALKTCDNENVK